MSISADKKSFFMINPAIVEDSQETYTIQENYKETYGLDALGLAPSNEAIDRRRRPKRDGESALSDMRKTFHVA